MQNCWHQRVPQTAHRIICVSLDDVNLEEKLGSIVRVPYVQLKISSSLVVCVSVRFRAPTAPRPPSWPPRLVDEAGILETSRILRFASSCAASCQQAARHADFQRWSQMISTCGKKSCATYGLHECLGTGRGETSQVVHNLVPRLT